MEADIIPFGKNQEKEPYADTMRRSLKEDGTHKAARTRRQRTKAAQQATDGGRQSNEGKQEATGHGNEPPRKERTQEEKDQQEPKERAQLLVNPAVGATQEAI